MMLRKLTLITTVLLGVAALAACSDDTDSNGGWDTEQGLEEQAPTVEDGYLAEDAQNGMILHAWNWSMGTIEDHLEDIAIAGYSTIQISPMQPQKDYTGKASWGGNWWKLYQPLGFEIAEEDHAIGTLSDLESLTESADEYGIKVIVDVVANHLAQGDEPNTLHEDVESYEPAIYQENLLHTGYGNTNDSSIESVTRGTLGGLPDLKTGDETVQERTLHLLESYVDAGVDGFRFDAAKHIETPEDGEYASDFWPTVIDGVNDHASGELFIYGEILNTAGNNRSYADYVPYMGVTANTVSDAMRSAVEAEDAEALLDIAYLDGVPAEKTLLWAESHDDFAAGHTDSLETSLINRTYAIQASRKDATALYFSRPATVTMMGDVGSYDFEAHEVTESNRFNNYFIGTDEALSTHEGYFLNERFGDDKEGLMIVNLGGEDGQVQDMPVSHLSDGEYRDQISGSVFTVEDGRMSGEVGETGVAAVYNNPYEPKPGVYVSDTGVHGSFEDTKTITIYAHNATEARYRLNDGEAVEFTGNQEVELSHPDDIATVTLDIVVSYGDYTVEESYTYEKTDAVVDSVTVESLDASVTDGASIAAWAWPRGGDGQWVEGTLEGDTFTFDLPDDHDMFLLAVFEEGTTDFDWDDALEQTGDIEVPSDGVYDGSDMSWSSVN